MSTLLLSCVCDTVASKIPSNEIGLPVYEDIFIYPCDTIISKMGGWSVIFAILVFILALGCSFLIDRKYKWFEEVANKGLTFAFGLVWLFGFVVYDIGMYTGEPWSLLGNVPMAIVHAFGIFIFDSDVSAIHEPFHNNAWFMAAFSLVHFLAALVSLVFVLKHFGYNMIAAFRRRFLGSSKENTFVFWGLNDATYYLAKDINKQFAEVNNHRIVVVRTNADTEKENTPNGMNRLFSFLSLKNRDLDRLKDLDCITINTFVNISTFETDGDVQLSLDILEKKFRLKSLCRIIRKKTSSTLHLFFLSSDDNANIQAVANLKRDKTIQEFAKRGKVKLYCHARYNSIHRVIEDELTDKNIEVKVVDSSHICVELMKGNLELHPVKYVKVGNDATVSSPFNALVIGFGEVGMDAVRFLYEFGAFVNGNSRNGIVERSEFHCHVVDEKMEELAGLFTANAPSIVTSKNWKQEDDNKMINFYNIDCRSVEFYEKLKNWVEKLNYIVVATGDDETNISLAVRLFRLAIRSRQDDLKMFRILVRIQHDENGHIKKIAEHYNRLWAAELQDKADEKNKKKKLHQKSVTSNAQIETPITLFGSTESVYQYNNIIDSSLIEKAKKFKRKYDLSINELRIRSGEEPYPIEEWEDEQNNAMQIVGDYKGYSATLGGVMRLRRVQSQNLGNCLHEATKKVLAEVALGKEYEVIFRHGLIRNEGELVYSWRDHSSKPIANVQKVLSVLAQTEHLRWNASHEILGYQGNEDEGYKDEARLVHGCLREWDKLKDITKSYDYNIVDVSLGIMETDSSNA